jgi:pimeloyl-ACP methyl ester carboxylesterase
MGADFTTTEVKTGETTIFARVGGSGPPVLLLHGFPETHLMWREIAPILAPRFTVVARGPARLRAQRLPGFGAESRTLCETRHGEGLGGGNETPRIRSIWRRRA